MLALPACEHAEFGMWLQGYLDDCLPRRDVALPTLGKPATLPRWWTGSAYAHTACEN